MQSIRIYKSSEFYELTDHLGNVRVVFSDRKIVEDTDNDIDSYALDVKSWGDYYAFGMPIPSRTYNAQEYRFGFNEKEMDNEWTGTEGSHLNFKYRIHDARIGRFLSVDPLTAKYPYYSPYAFSENSTIAFVELESLEKIVYLFSPEQSVKFKFAVQEGDIFEQKRIIDYAIHNGFTNSDIISRINDPKAPNDNRSAALAENGDFYGVIVVPFRWAGNLSKIERGTYFWLYRPNSNSMNQRYDDKSYPIDIKSESFYGDYDAKGDISYQNENDGFITMNVKGFGYVGAWITQDGFNFDLATVGIVGAKYIGDVDTFEDKYNSLFKRKYLKDENAGVFSNGSWEFEIETLSVGIPELNDFVSTILNKSGQTTQFNLKPLNNYKQKVEYKEGRYE